MNAQTTLRQQLILAASQAHTALATAEENEELATSAHYAHDGISITTGSDLAISAGLHPTISLDGTVALGLTITVARTQEALYLLDDVISAVKRGDLDALEMGNTALAQAEIDHMSGYPQVLGWENVAYASRVEKDSDCNGNLMLS